MATFGKTIGTGVAAALLVAAITTGATGAPGGAVLNRLDGVKIRGNVVCAACSLAEVQVAPPSKYRNHLLQLTHRAGQVVMEVDWVDDSRWWNHLTVPQIQVRGKDSLFEQLTTEENLFKEVELAGIPYNSRTLDISQVTIRD